MLLVMKTDEIKNPDAIRFFCPIGHVPRSHKSTKAVHKTFGFGGQGDGNIIHMQFLCLMVKWLSGCRKR